MNFQLNDDDDLFARFARPSALKEIEDKVSVNKHNYCSDCDIPMEIVEFEYRCKQCFQVSSNDIDTIDHNDAVSSTIRVTTGSHKGRFYNTVGDYSKTQHKDVYNLLKANQAKYEGLAIADSILKQTAAKYNELQKMMISTSDEGKSAKKFVKRSSMRAEILAALLESFCNLAGAPRDKRDIARFMGLSTDGYSRGQKIVDETIAQFQRNQSGLKCTLQNIPELTIGEKSAKMLAERYLEALNIVTDSEKYINFICDIVAESDRKKVCVSSRLSSKVVGVIWTIVCRCKLNVTARQLENATDNTKKNTFIKFHNAVVASPGIFGAIFAKYQL